jgi:dihydropteroate synthase
MISPLRTQIMAILNITPDSFSDGGKLSTVEAAVQQAAHAIAAGAHILDIGGESTRPGAATIDPAEEVARVRPVIEAIHDAFPSARISIDTRKALVAKAAIQAGASMINDVSGLQYDSAMAKVAADTGAQLIIMHSQGTPETMQQNPHYTNGVVTEVLRFFERQIAFALSAGVQREQLILDPGFGFGKTIAHNLTLLQQLSRLRTFGLPLLVGTSRKSFLTLGNQDIPVNEREALTAASITLALQQGASYIRIHDVATQVPVIRLVEATFYTQPDSKDPADEFASL